MRKRIFLTIFLFFAGGILFAEQIYLKNGENIHGTITEIQGDLLTIESDLGYGIIRVSKKDVITVTFPYQEINLTRRYALGYVNRKQDSIGSATKYNYRTDQFSLKTYMTKDIFLQYMIGYGQVEVLGIGNTRNKVSSFTSNLRAAKVLFKQQNSLVYAGLGLGIVSIQDTSHGYNEQGTDVGIIFGGEIFIGALPDFGISAEIEFSRLSGDSIQRSDLNISALPTFSVHYYF